MSPLNVQRYEFSLNEAVEALLGEALGDCEKWELRVSNGSIVIDFEYPVAGIPVPEPKPAPAQPKPIKPKGGALARRAGIMCNERGFQTFLDVSSADAAANLVRQKCGIESRAQLDHDDTAGEIFGKIDQLYKMWLDGYDTGLGDLTQ